MTRTDEEKELLYYDLDYLIASTPSDKLIIMEDFNARVGRGATWNQVIGEHGIWSENSNGLLLLGECIKHKLAISKTKFRSKQWHHLDYVIVRQRDVSDVNITTAMRGADG